MTISRRRFLEFMGLGGAAAAVSVGWIGRALGFVGNDEDPEYDGPSLKPHALNSSFGNGFLAYAGDAPNARILHEHLVDLGFREQSENSQLGDTYALGPDRWIAATQAEATMLSDDGRMAVLTHIAASEDDELRSRPPEAHIWSLGRWGRIDSVEPVAVLAARDRRVFQVA